MFEKYFALKQNNTNIKTEFIAGLTTFMTMAYILVVNPVILSKTGMDYGAVFTATALSACIATIVMALVAKLPLALAPGMGLNAFFAFTVVLGMGYTWQMALAAVFIEGVLFIILTLLNIREAIINSIPLNLKYAVSVGIGLFISFIGLVNSGIVVTGMNALPNGTLDGIVVKAGNMADPGVLLAIGGIILTGVLLVFKVKGALFFGILATALAGIPVGVTVIPQNFNPIDLPPSLSPIFFQFDFSKLLTIDFAVVFFTFLFVNLFDTVGTLIGVGAKANLLDKDGKMPRAKEALLADAVGTTVGAVMGTSPVATYVESAAGVAEGGRTGLTALVVAVFFGLAMFIAPLFLLVPTQATAPALVLVGLFMMSPINKIDFNDYTNAIPAFLTIIMMPFSYSIAEGIVFGMISYVFIKLFSGRHKEISPVLYVLAIVFIIKFFI